MTTVLLAAATASAQPAPIGAGGIPLPPPTDNTVATDGTPVDPPLDPNQPDAEHPIPPDQIPKDPYAHTAEPTRKAVPRPPISMPEVLTTQTGWLLPAAVLYSRTSIDTGGGVTSDNRVGLGDVAEFGIATIDSVREREDKDDTNVERIQPYVLASFRLGVQEERLFSGQPGVTLGFRKSFERNHNDYKTQIAELTLIASKHFGKNTALHIGGAFWDASVYGQFGEVDADGKAKKTEVTFHDGENFKNQVRAFGGLEVTPLPNSQILVDLGWAPEFCYHCDDADKIKLRPTLSWGVRYRVAEFMNLEAGVKVPDIASANLLDAQIFGQMTFTSWALRRAVDSLK
ncbi:MAG TPA: hypothetical protein VGM90_38360 [Kofleriaceae bacterium]